MSTRSDILGIRYRTGFEAKLAVALSENPRTGEHLLDIKRLLIRFLRCVFETEPAEKDAPASLAWRENEEPFSEVFLSDEAPLNPKSVEKTTAVILQRGDFGWGGVGIDQMLHENARDGTVTSTDLFVGSFTFNCVSNESIWAERIAVSVFRLLTYYRSVLQASGLFRLDHGKMVIQRARPAGDLVVDAPTDKFIVHPVYVPIYYQDTWEQIPESERLRRVRYTLVARGRLIDGSPIFEETFDLGETTEEG